VKQGRTNLAKGLLVIRIVLKRGICELFKLLEARAFVLFGKNDIETDDPRLVFIEQVFDNDGELVATPGPATDFGK